MEISMEFPQTVTRKATIRFKNHSCEYTFLSKPQIQLIIEISTYLHLYIIIQISK